MTVETEEYAVPDDTRMNVSMEEDETESSDDIKNSPKSRSLSSPHGEVFNPQLLKMYYQRLFPYHYLHSWLCYDPSITDKKQASGENKSLTTASASGSKMFSRREFSYTIMIDQEEIYIRYQSYSNLNDLCKAIQKRQPVKIDIGAVFSHPPKDQKALASGTFTTQQRELVFDIDLTDYDDTRMCGCSGAKICNKCWKLMTMAVKVMDEGLRDDFGFGHIGWFYSGRRGVHAWVCDESARLLSNEARSAVAHYFEINLGSDKNKGVQISYPLHPMMKRAYSILEPLFQQHIVPATGQGLFATSDNWSALLDSLPEIAQPVRANLSKAWSKASNRSTEVEKWQELKQHLNVFGKKIEGSKASKTMSNADRAALEIWPVATVFRYTYPRLDINVSKMQNHLLKSPFCVHPKTGRVCVPIQVDEIDNFDPFAVPTLPQLMQELDDFHASDENMESDAKTKSLQYDWQKTSLKAPFEAFQTNFLNPLMKDLRKKQRADKEEQAALVGDF